MSKIPGLLRQTADSLRKEAEDRTSKAEDAFYAAQQLVKVAYEAGDAVNTALQVQMVDAMKEQADIARNNGLMSAIHNRVTDITPEEEIQRLQYQAASFHTGKRRSKIGRPTKKERRELDEFLDD